MGIQGRPSVKFDNSTVSCSFSLYLPGQTQETSTYLDLSLLGGGRFGDRGGSRLPFREMPGVVWLRVFQIF